MLRQGLQILLPNANPVSLGAKLHAAMLAGA
ncbi:hypothetical protein SAMN05720354_11756 [Nitrosospira sp. Nsp1]|nr:hypothetical protein SAMN05720354_11756 [Nitrosospira sp. Nsp1]